MALLRVPSHLRGRSWRAHCLAGPCLHYLKCQDIRGWGGPRAITTGKGVGLDVIHTPLPTPPDHCLGQRTPAFSLEKLFGDFPGGAVVKNPPASAGDTGSSPGPGRSHMLRSN